MQKFILSLTVQLAWIGIATGIFFALAPVTQAQGPGNGCNGGVLFTDQSGRTYCISQPDSLKSGTRQTSSPLGSTPPITTTPTPVICDGDGSSGYRVQVVYAYIITNTSRFSTYRTSIQQWAYGVDKDMVDSAAATGGVRHVRYVTELASGNCYPLVIEVALPSTVLQGTGAQRFSRTISEIQKLGYKSQDRNYMIFLDAQQSPDNICGIGTVQYDDSAGQTNINNSGPNYMQIDDNCWSSVIPGHELMHNLGGVQMSAPHSDGNYHCTDGYDNMCDHGGSPARTYTACPDPVGDHLLDCNHDDYFNTNPPANSYLATHWNTANNRFLIYANQTAVRVDSIVTGKLNGSVFAATDTFASGDTVVTRVHMADTNGVSLSGASVNFTINQPNGTPQCTFTGLLTDSNGIAQGTCLIPPTAPTGSWTGKISTFTRASYPADSNDSVTQKVFSVGYAPTVVTLSSFTAQTEATMAKNPVTLILIVAIILSAVITLGARLAFAPVRN